MLPVAHIRSPFAEKFGVPRQSHLAPSVVAEIVFEPAFRRMEFVRGLEGFSHLWLIWGFHRNGDHWNPTVRPPRLGGNERVGVFATRSPFRPNGLGLSAVRLLEVLPGPVLRVSGIDMVDGTPVLDIKPYLAVADSIPSASGGFAAAPWPLLEVRWDVALPTEADVGWRAAVEEILTQDPRPAYQRDTSRRYGLTFGHFEVTFFVEGRTVRVTAVTPAL